MYLLLQKKELQTLRHTNNNVPDSGSFSGFLSFFSVKSGVQSKSDLFKFFHAD